MVLCASNAVVDASPPADQTWGTAVNNTLHVSQEVALSDNRQHLDELPARARETLLSVVAAYIPYYNPPHVSRRHPAN
jgi:hypothetical protein